MVRTGWAPHDGAADGRSVVTTTRTTTSTTTTTTTTTTTKETTMTGTTTPQEIAERYIAVWIEPDPALRRRLIEEVWAQDGVHVLQPPEEIRDRAAELGFDSPTLEARGHNAVEARVARSHQEFVADGEHTFRARDTAVRLGDVLRFTWEMVPTGGGEALGSGVEFLVLDGEDRVTADYMFPGP
ncbi:hypothetical protein [Kitasatospora sp. NPDC058218]|uniref:hypothetical protein n=1 Tax=Kitasatospora sp. NPDC058218 TaxID=3346385 RepID=UPI0036DBDF12